MAKIHLTQKYYLVAISIILLLGVTTSIWMGIYLRQQATVNWLAESMSENNRISNTFLNWLENEQGPIRSLSTLFYNTNTVQLSMIDEQLFHDTISFLEFTESSVNDLSIAYAEEQSDGQLIIKISTINNPPFQLNSTISNLDYVRSAVQQAFKSPDKIIMSNVFNNKEQDILTLYCFLVPNGNSGGILFNLINLTTLFKELDSLHIEQGIQLRVAIETEQHQKQFIYGTSKPAPLVVNTNLIRGLSMGQSWFFYWDTLPSYNGGPKTTLPTILSITGNLITIITALFIWFLMKRNQIITSKVVQRSKQLEQAYHQLNETQMQLIHSEKMASLGNLVAGVAHELNTPLGNAVTLASNIEENTVSITKMDQNKTLDKRSFYTYLHVMQESSQLLLKNAQRASQLVRNFKQVAVDQTSEQRRTFNCIQATEELISTLTPMFKHTKHKVVVEGDSATLDSYPGAFGQIITNLVTNALVHGFEHIHNGRVTILFTQVEQQLRIEVSDTGRGIPPNHLNKIFEPFFTTKFGKGGSGLGLNIVYNIVTGLLKGTIHVENQDPGAKFTIEIPLVASKAISDSTKT